jgi:hypothetical protein
MLGDRLGAPAQVEALPLACAGCEVLLGEQEGSYAHGLHSFVGDV